MNTNKKTTSKTADAKTRVMIPWIVLIGFLAYLVFAIAFPSLGFAPDQAVAIVAAVIIVLLEVSAAALLFRTPLFVHGLVFLGQIILGLVFHRLPLMVIMAVLYAFAIVVLYFWTREEKA